MFSILSKRLSPDWQNIVALGSRQAWVQGLGIVNGIVLARLISPAEFGIYALLTFQFFLQLGIGDLGLGASVIRQKEEPTKKTLSCIFTLRQILDLTQLILIWTLAPRIAALYDFSQAAAAFNLVAVAVFLQSFQVVPTVLLDRNLKFSKVAVIETTQALTFSLVCISSAALGYGVIGIGAAWISFAVVGGVLASYLSPWKIAWSFSFTEISARLRYSLSFQAANLITILKDGVTPVGLGIFLGATTLGYFNWAQMFALSFATGALILQRYFIPVMAKVQDQPEELNLVYQRAITLSHSIIAPLALTLLALAKPITLWIFGEKWLSALPLFYSIWGANLFIPFNVAVFALFYATGRSEKALLVAGLICLSSWVIGVLALKYFGASGFALAQVCVAALILIPLYLQRTRLKAKTIWFIAEIWIVGIPLAALINYGICVTCH